MAGKLPMQDEPSVAPRPAAPAFFDAHASPDSFGAPQGAALQADAQEGAAIAMHKRQLDANFAAADSELAYGKNLDAQLDKYKADLKKLQADNVGDYSAAVDQLRAKYGEDLEKSRKEYQGGLQDPLAAKQFALRTRLQTQAIYRHMGVVGDQRVEEWRKGTAVGNVALQVKLAGNMTGDLQVDLATVQVAVATGAKALQDYHAANTVPKPEADAATAKVETDAVHSALKGYGTNAAAGLAFLNAKMLGTGVRIGFNPNKPDEPSILNGADTQAWVAHFTTAAMAHKSAESAARGLDFASSNWTSMGDKQFEGAARKEFLGENRDPAAYDSAMTHFSKFQGERHAAVERSRAEATQQAADAVIQYGGYEAAKAAGKIPPNTNVAAILGVDARFNTYASRPVVARLGGAINDPANAGYSSAVSMEDYTAALVAARLPEKEIQRAQAAYHKDAASTAALAKSPGTGVALANVRDTLRAELGVSQITGKNMSDLKQQWQRDVVTAAETELLHRIAVAQPKAGTTTLPQEEAVKIASDVGRMIPDLKERAKRGESVITTYPPVATQPTDAAKLAAARVINTLSAAPVQARAASTLKPGDTFTGRDDKKYRVLPDGKNAELINE